MVIGIIIATVLFSIIGFRNSSIMDRFDLNPYMIVKRNQWYRVITHAFLHADFTHLLINMLVFFSFAVTVEDTISVYYRDATGNNLPALFLIFYFTAIIISSLSTIIKYREQPYYRALGASGAVSAVTFCFIFFYPWHKLLILGIIPVPGIIFGGIYLVYSQIMTKRGGDNINHDAHFYGAAYGLFFPLLINSELFFRFIEKVLNP